MTQLVSGRFNVNNHAHVVAGTSRCSAAWFALYFQHRNIVLRLTRQGATRYKLNKATLESLPLPLPHVDEQRAICQCFEEIDEALRAETEHQDALRVLKSALASALLTGELRVTPDEATP